MTSHTQQLHSTQTKSVELGLEEHFLEVLSFYFFALVFGQSVFFLTACVLSGFACIDIPAHNSSVTRWISSDVDFLKSAPLDLSINPLTPIVAIWRHTYFRHHNFIKKC